MPTIEPQITFAINAKPEIGFAAGGAARGGGAAARGSEAGGGCGTVGGAPGGMMAGEGCSGGWSGAAGWAFADLSPQPLAHRFMTSAAGVWGRAPPRPEWGHRPPPRRLRCAH